jgi:PAS domain S-box-containing protein
MGERDYSYFDVLVGESPLIAWIKDARGRYVFVNPAWGTTFGRSPSNVVGKVDVDLWPPETARVLVENDDYVRTTGQVLEVKESAANTDGVLRSFLSIKFPARDQMVAGVAIEMTDRWPEVADREIAEARAQLKTSRDMIEAIHRAQSQFIARFDARVTFNGLLDILLALTRSEYGFVGEVLLDEHHNPYLRTLAITNIAWNEETRARYERYSESGMEFRNLKTLFGAVMTTRKAVIANDAKNDPRSGGLPHGHPAMHTFLGVPFFSGDNLVGMLGIANKPHGYDEKIARDLDPFLSTCANLVEAYRNERRRTDAEHALRESEAQLRAVVDHASDGIFVSRGGILVEVNPAAAHILRLSREQLLGRAISDFLADSQHERLAATLKGAGQAPLFEEWAFYRSDGSEAIGEVHISVTPDGLTLAVVRDVTERRRSERAKERADAALRHSQKMAAIGTLAGGIAHDFNNLLAIIHGNASFVQDGLGAGHEMYEALDDLLIASRRARDLIKRILTFSRQGETSMSELNPRPTIAEALRLLRSTIPAGVELAIALDEDAPLVLGDATQLHQVVVNLVTNAWQALDGRPGRVSVSLTSRHLPENFHPDLHEGPHLVLAVHDTGRGIDPKNISRIFEPFFTTKELEGTGLGLSVVHGVVRGHHGAITVDREPSPGTTFTVYLPALARTGLTAVKSDTELVRRGDGQRVLLIDDEPALVASMTRQLTQLGYRPSGFSDPREAVALFFMDPSNFDLVLTDHAMPRMSGIEVAFAIHERVPGLPIILSSGLLTDEEIAEARRAGVADILPKPSSIEELGQVLAAQLLMRR